MVKYQFNPLFEGKLGRAIDSSLLKNIDLIKDPEIKSKMLQKAMNQIRRQRKQNAEHLKSLRKILRPEDVRRSRDFIVNNAY